MAVADVSVHFVYANWLVKVTFDFFSAPKSTCNKIAPFFVIGLNAIIYSKQ